MDLPPNSAFGISGGDELRDVIMYQSRTSRTHQVHIIAHELSHIILDHPRLAVRHSYQPPVGDFQEISDDVIELIFGSTLESEVPAVSNLYADPAEWEAETMATILLGWMDESAGSPISGQGHRLASALGYPNVWM
ncbi:ImmA/IrrE family metallo-endopeptidase [Pseudonocardia sp. TRM90224]|uniref:ImmA/IrrE family metallo-endopeptidase n=1 Tax=Pseudonocardia sp. TRM90224 TaxID=2812678 RepID=UPI001E4298A4|nr:ImmA/IrrE family metallo-endopeptidase [Pseudonocardia sp. TRM90224]